MTVQTQSNKTIALGDGITTQFAFDFVGVAAAYIDVIFTDASGNATTLTEGAGTTQYQIALNAPVTGAIWGQGGIVTYNPSGTPIPNGTTLTIFRTLPLTQAVSLQNQISLSALGNGAEVGLDTLEMQLQQTSEATVRAITAPIVDPSTINLVMPPAAQRALTGLAFDSQGNVIAGTTPATGLISTAMQPVVAAASLALGRTAFGLGNIATQNIGAGLQNDGAGNVRVNSPAVQVATNQVVTASFDLNRYIATGPINFTLPRGNTLWNGFGFWIEAKTGDITVIPNAADTIADTTGSGVSFTVPAGASIYITTDAATNANWYVEGMPWLVQNVRSATGTCNITAADNAKILRHTSGTFGTFIFPAGATLPANFRCVIQNGDGAQVGKGVGGTDVGSFTMYSGQSYLVINDHGTVRLVGGKQLFTTNSIQLFANSGGGSDDPLVADGLAAGSRAKASLGGMKAQLYQDFNHNGSQPLCTASGTFNESLQFFGQPINCNVFFWNGTSPGAFLWRPASIATPFCAIIGDGGTCEMGNVWTDGNAISSTAFQLHQTGILDILSGCAFGSHGTGNHFALDGCGASLNIDASYAVNGAGGAANHIQVPAVGIVAISGAITVTITNTPNIGTWFRQIATNTILMGVGVVFSGSTLAGGKKWDCGSASCLAMNGNAANIPGTIAGTPAVGAAPTASTGFVTN